MESYNIVEALEKLDRQGKKNRMIPGWYTSQTKAKTVVHNVSPIMAKDSVNLTRPVLRCRFIRTANADMRNWTKKVQRPQKFVQRLYALINLPE